jgi:hypothetical protein
MYDLQDYLDEEEDNFYQLQADLEEAQEGGGGPPPPVAPLMMGANDDDCFDEVITASEVVITGVAATVGYGGWLSSAFAAGVTLTTTMVVGAYAVVGVAAVTATVAVGTAIACLTSQTPFPLACRQDPFSFEPPFQVS